MRSLAAIVMFALAFWRAALDWSATAGAGKAWRFATLEEFSQAHWPDFLEITKSLVGGVLGPDSNVYSGIVLQVPVVAYLCFAGGFIWMFRTHRSRF